MESKTKYYCVAQHTFGLQMAEDSPLWNMLGAYEPFRVEAAESKRQTVFFLTVEEGRENFRPEDTAVKVNCPQEPDARMDVYTTPDGWLFCIAPGCSLPAGGRLLASTEFHRATLVLEPSNPYWAYCLNNAMMLLYALSTAPRNTLQIHASMVESEGKAYLFLGKSGTGKSTHSRLWLEHIGGTELMNDDNPILRIGDDNVLRAYGSPWSGKTPCYRNVSAPVGALVCLKQAPENRISRLGKIGSYGALFASCSSMRWDKFVADGQHVAREWIALHTPFYRLECLPDEEAARLCERTVKENNLKAIGL